MMKRSRVLVAVLLLLSPLAFAQFGPNNCTATSPNIGLNVPGNGCFNNSWDVPYNQNWNKIDQYLSGLLTAPAYKAQAATITGLTTGNCVQAGTGGLLTTTSQPCFVNNFTFSGTHTGNLATYDPANWIGANALACRSNNGDLTTVACGGTSGTNVLLSPAGNQTVTEPAGFVFNINVMEQWVFADNYAPSSSGGINEAFAACNNGGNCRVIAGLGTVSACNISIPSQTVLQGHGRNLTTLSCGTASAPVVADMASSSRIESLEVKHSVQPTSTGDGIVTSGDRVTLFNIKADNNYNNFRLGPSSFGEAWGLISENCDGDALKFDTSIVGAAGNVFQWVIHGGLFQKCSGWGVDMVNATATVFTGPRMEGYFHVFGNNTGGIRFQDTSTGRLSNIFLGEGVVSSNNGDNILIDTLGRNVSIQGEYNEQSGQANISAGAFHYGYNGANSNSPTNVGRGIAVTSNCDNTNPPILVGNRFWENADDAVVLQCPGAQATSTTAFDCAFAHNSGTNAAVRTCISIQANDVNVNGVFCSQGGTHALSCVDISNSADTPDVIGWNCGNGFTEAACISQTTAPANGFHEGIGSVVWIQKNAAASGSCINGSLWSRTDTGALYVCQGGSWVAK